jgi:hypothetical protein
MQTPAVIGQKFIRVLDAFCSLDPILTGWVIWEAHCTLDELEDWVERGSPEPPLIRPVALDDARKAMTTLVETNVFLDDWGEERPDDGYRLNASNRFNQSPLGVNVSVVAGSRFDRNYWRLNFGANPVITRSAAGTRVPRG